MSYTYTTSTLSVVDHWYRYSFDDGSDKPAITTLLLSQSSVSPTSGPSSTVFTFQTTYTNTTHVPPTQALLYVDNTSYPMSYVSGSNSTAALYQVQTTLPSGNHTFFFVFKTNQTAWADPFAPTVYQGPNVGASAKAVKPGSIIVDSGDGDGYPDDPGYVPIGPDGVGYDPS